jgi:hypothetical protein
MLLARPPLNRGCMVLLATKLHAHFYYGSPLLPRVGFLLSSQTPCIQADEIIPEEIKRIFGYQFLVPAQLLRCRQERERRWREREREVYGRRKKIDRRNRKKMETRERRKDFMKKKKK